ncbi:hypothetical protein LAG90_15590 [Marinilongibacter aquaticus]|uniref:hypothetical protein n=1 Tax=Marinilongibacter aquaticus TaxID=2975157 RepID=UPI0021BD66A7|nr:hypothetical protein [Marinilongibacter aquaticus]UBM58226.1 hypothetical protein LAG90_15590 [Marinilongibacter aquaticus]
MKKILIFCLLLVTLSSGFAQWQATVPHVRLTDGQDYLSLSYKEKRGVKFKWAWIKSQKNGLFDSWQFKFENWKPADSLDAVTNLPKGWAFYTEQDSSTVPSETEPAQWSWGNFEQRTVAPFEGMAWDAASVAYTIPQKWPIEPQRHDVTLPDVYPVWGTVLEKSDGPFKYDDFSTGKIRASNNTGIIKRESGLYFVKPNGFVESKNDAYKYLDEFPEFTLPKGKIHVNDCIFYKDRSRTDFLKKGSSHLPLNDNVERAEKYIFVGDGWVLDLKMPAAYTQPVTYGGKVYQSRSEAFNQWCRDVDADALLAKFQSVFGPLGNSYDIIELNGEGYLNDWWVDRWKLEACFDWWASQVYRAKFGGWAVAPYQLTRVMWQGQPLKIKWDQLPYSDRGAGLNAGITNLHKNLGFWEVYAYENNFQNHNIVHHLLTQYRLNKFYAQLIGKDIPVLVSFFPEIDATDAYLKFKNIYREASDGTKYFSETKPEVHPETMQSVAAWSIAITDGAILWDNYLRFLEEPTDDYGFGWDYENQRRFWRLKDGQAAYFYQDRSNVDWWMAGIWAVSQNKDIIDDESTEWKWPNGSPDAVAADEGLLVAYKKSGKSILVMALANWDEEGTKSHVIEIEGKKYTIFTDGQWTSIIRFETPGINGTNPEVPEEAIEPEITEPETVEETLVDGLPEYVASATNEVFKWDGWDRGDVGYSYNADYFELANQVPGGVAYFNFVGQDVNYPAKRTYDDKKPVKDGLVMVDLPSHSTTANWFSVKDYHTISKVRMELWDSNGNMVWQVFDTKGGFHSLDTKDDSHRGNNHPDNARRWIKPGNYTLKYWNLIDEDEKGVTDQNFEFYANGNVIISEAVHRGEYKEYQLNMSGLVWYKLNCNLY